MTPEWARQYKLVQETVPRSKVVGAVGRYKDDVDEREHSIDLTEESPQCSKVSDMECHRIACITNTISISIILICV